MHSPKTGYFVIIPPTPNTPAINRWDRFRGMATSKIKSTVCDCLLFDSGSLWVLWVGGRRGKTTLSQ